VCEGDPLFKIELFLDDLLFIVKRPSGDIIRVVSVPVPKKERKLLEIIH